MLKQKKSSIVSHRAMLESIQLVDKQDWDDVVASRNIYLSYDYLISLETAMKGEIDFYYSVSYTKEGGAALVMVLQLVKLINKRKKHSELFGRLPCHIYKKLTDFFTVNILVCGNVFSDGENGFLWSSALSTKEAMNEACQVVKEFKENENAKLKASVSLFKEFWSTSKVNSDHLKTNGYRNFMIDVNMVLNIDKSWETIDDYLASMKTKFRTRAKRVFKQSADIVVKTLTVAEIIENRGRISELFENVIKKSDFSVGRLNTDVFELFKRNLNDRFLLRAFYLNDEMVGFSTSFLNGDVFEANYVGLDYKYNNKLSIYQRILYDYVELSLKTNSKELHLGRTAELMKSSIGALPKNMTLYAKHRSSVRNFLLKPIIKSISPSEFELRKPFKSNYRN